MQGKAQNHLMIHIKNINAYWVLDSRSNPTVEVKATVHYKNQDFFAIASVPSGASTGTHEALEMRDGGEAFGGKGVQNAINNVNTIIKNSLVGSNFENADQVDEKILQIDGTENKTKLGANAILGISMAIHRVFAKAKNLELYEYLRQLYFAQETDFKSPKIMANIINGGEHAQNEIDIQEFMIISQSPDLLQNIQNTTEIYNVLKNNLKKEKLSTGLGDEGGFAPEINNTKNALDFIVKSVENRENIALTLDCAASEFYNADENIYKIDGKKLNAEDLAKFYEDLVEKYNIISIEDPFAEDDLAGWKIMTEKLGKKIKLVGDDLFVTNPKRLVKIGLEQNIANSILIKPNQIGSIKETCDTINLAKKHKMTTIISHRSGETSDDFISDLGFASNSEFVKIGAPARGERCAKYNRLIQIYNQINS